MTAWTWPQARGVRHRVPRGSDHPMRAEVAQLRDEVAALRRGRVRYLPAAVTARNAGTSTFTAAVAGGVNGQTIEVGGISSPPQFLPDVGQTVLLTALGPQPVYQPTGIAQDAISMREISELLATDGGGNQTIFDPSGLRVYRADAIDGLVESGRLGFGPGDYVGGGATSTGDIAWSVDSTGAGNFAAQNVVTDPVLMGLPFTTWLGRASGGGNGGGGVFGAEHWYGYDAAGLLANISGEAGLVEMSVEVAADRMYWLCMEVAYTRSDPLTEMILRVRDGGTGSPSGASPAVNFRRTSAGVVNYDQHFFSPGLWVPSYTGTHRLLLTAERAAGTPGLVSITAGNGGPVGPTMYVIDLGPKKQILATVSRGTGTTPPPVSEEYVDLEPTSYQSYTGTDTLRTGTTDIVQGWDPNGEAGDGKGHWAFTLPSITGTVNRAQFYVECKSTGFDTGGTAMWNLISITGVANPTKLRTDQPVGGYPRPGAKTWTLPTDWLPFFRNASTPRAIGISAGPSGGSNPQYYCRFGGPTARLRLWYTQ